jgi:hypothetical protein
MPALLPDIDPDGLLEYSVVFTDRSLNSMSQRFKTVMQDISGALKRAYNAHSVIAIPGGGTYGMEAIRAAICRRPACNDYPQRMVSVSAGARFWRKARLPKAVRCWWRHDNRPKISITARRPLHHTPLTKFCAQIARGKAGGGICPACRNICRHDPA